MCQLYDTCKPIKLEVVKQLVTMDSLKSALRRGTQTIKEKLGKSQTTVDEEYVAMYGQFDITHKTSKNFVKHVGQLIENFHAMSSTLHFLAEDFRDLYSHTNDETKKEASLLLMSVAEELENKAVIPFQNQVTAHILDPANAYLARFPAAKDLHKQRKKLLLEYDYYRDKVQSLSEKQSKNPLELPKVKEKMNQAKDDYEQINALTKNAITELLESKGPVYAPVVEQLIGNLIQYNDRTSNTMNKLKKFGAEPLAGAAKSSEQVTANVGGSSSPAPVAQPRTQRMYPQASKEAPVPPQFDCEWFYLDSNVEQQGPFTFKDMRQKFKSNAINAQTHVFGGELSDWKMISDVPDFKRALSA
jgi:hypothetical protein